MVGSIVFLFCFPLVIAKHNIFIQLSVAAPMVRYSKLAFRLLVQDYNVDLTYTPMMLAHEYVPP